MTFFYSFILSLIVIFILSLIFKAEAVFWWEKIRGKIRPKKEEEPKKFERGMPIEKFCGFRNWSDKGGEYCTLFQLHDGSEYSVNEEICRKCRVWDRYEAWLDSGKKENLSVTLIHTLLGSKPLVVETDKLNPEAEKGLSFNDFVIKRRHVPWAGKAAIAFLTLITYLIVYFSGIFSNPVIYAMPDTFYFLSADDKAVVGSNNMRPDEPSSQDLDTNCNLYQEIEEGYCHLNPGVGNDTYEGVYSGPKKKGWMTDDETPLTGTIASGNWTVNADLAWTVSSSV